MDRMSVVVFDTEKKSYEGKQTLLQLDGEGSIVLYAYAVVAKDADGSVTVRQSDDPGPLGSLIGTSLGSLIGLLGGPAGSRGWRIPGIGRRQHGGSEQRAGGRRLR